MTLKINITDPATGVQARVVDHEEDNALVVATRPLKTFTTHTTFFLNDTYGREMAQNGAFGGTPLLLHDGVDTAAWTFSQVAGAKWTADSTDRYYADAASMKCNNPSVGDIMQIINNVGPGNNIDMTGNYVALTFWINVDSYWLGGDSISLYAFVDGSQVGNKVNLEDYFPWSDYDEWHFVNIPLTDMGIESSSIDAFRIENETREGGLSPIFYIDEWYLQETGAAIIYTVEPDKGTWFYIKTFHTTFVDAYNADNADSTMPHLSYNKILGMDVTAGYVLRQYIGEGDTPTGEDRVTSLMDLLSYPYATISNNISDGTNTLITIENSYPEMLHLVLKSENLDKLTFTIEDNFGDLLYFRVSVTGYVEQRQ
jgi:hypothetical protein